MKTREIKEPTERDLAIWRTHNQELSSWLNQGLTGFFQVWGHRKIRGWTKSKKGLVLDVGCGNGLHITYTTPIYEKYLGLDLDYNRLKTFTGLWGGMPLLQGEAYMLPFMDHSLDNVISIYNLEHLNYLEQSLMEIKRVLKINGNLFVAVPAEGGFLYNLGRRFTSKRYMEKKYGIDYDALVHHEHCNEYKIIANELAKKFNIKRRFFIPFPFLPIYHANAIVCFSSINNC